MKLIGITGRIGAGKDTVAAILAENHGYRTTAFADLLKSMVARLACEPLENFYDRELKERYSPALGMTRRLAMQKFGTEVGRNLFGPHIWSDATLTAWRQEGSHPTVICDVRFDDEALSVLREGGVILEITRPGTDTEVTHASEAGVDPGLIGYRIVNDGTLEELAELVDAFAAALEADSAT